MVAHPVRDGSPEAEELLCLLSKILHAHSRSTTRRARWGTGDGRQRGTRSCADRRIGLYRALGGYESLFGVLAVSLGVVSVLMIATNYLDGVVVERLLSSL